VPRKKSPLDASQAIKPVLLRLPHNLYVKLKLAAVREGRTATQIMLDAVGQYLKAAGKAK
jgi:hypothetical protein